MEVPYYAEQFRGILPELIGPQTYEQARNDNAQAIDAFNTRVENGEFPPEVSAAPTFKGTYGMLTRRTTADGFFEFISLSKIVDRYEMDRLLPGVVDYDAAEMMFSAYLTKNDYIRDKPRMIAFGRYLVRTGLYTDVEVNKMANALKSTIRLMQNLELKMATTSEDIVEVYLNGPHSCMKYDFDELPHHPVYVYGAGDIGCAYVEVNGKIVARAMVNLDAQEYSTIYGNADLLRKVLEKEGYTSGSLGDCRVLKIEVNETYLMPYIDGADSVSTSSCGEYFVIGGYGDYKCCNTNGLAEEGDPCCNCGDRVHEDEAYWIEGEGTVCSIECGEDLGYHMVNYEWYHEDDLVLCETDHEYHHADDDNLIRVDDEYYLETDDNVCYSEADSEWYLSEDCTYVGGNVDSWVLTGDIG